MPVDRLVIFAPNWLGDAVMALPAVADVRRAQPMATIVVAARPAIAPLFRIVGDVDDVIDVEGITSPFDVALLLPNSFRSALLAFRARISERWGYDTQLRAPLLTRGVTPARGVHQATYYQNLVHALGFPNGDTEPRLTVPEPVREIGARVLREAGCGDLARVVALAPGAAYGGAKRWPPERFAELARDLTADGVSCVMIGTQADVATVAAVTGAYDAIGGTKSRLHSLAGATDLPTLAGVLAHCRALVTNDSGAMHFGAAIGVPVTAVFGPTNDVQTRPIGDSHRVITYPVWCRPCMLRECPLDHACMRRIPAAVVVAEARRTL